MEDLTREIRKAGASSSSFIPNEPSLRSKLLVERREQQVDTEADTGGRTHKSSTAYATMMAEFQDGDTSEALAVALRGGRQNSRGELEDGDTEQLSEPRQRKAQSVPSTEEQEPENHLAGLRTRQRTAPIRGASDAANLDAPQPPSLKKEHDKLMLLSSQMRPSEAATLISRQAFDVVVAILDKSNWLRSPHCDEDLLRSQMA